MKFVGYKQFGNCQVYVLFEAENVDKAKEKVLEAADKSSRFTDYSMSAAHLEMLEREGKTEQLQALREYVLKSLQEVAPEGIMFAIILVGMILDPDSIEVKDTLLKGNGVQLLTVSGEPKPCKDLSPFYNECDKNATLRKKLESESTRLR